jgi:hypothetical protein
VKEVTVLQAGGHQTGRVSRATRSFGAALKTFNEPDSAVGPDAKPCKFSIPQKEHDQRIFYFESGQKVSDAKVTISEKHGLKELEFVTLLFLGKQLKDTFVSDKLGLGEKPIILHLRDISEVLLISGTAARKPFHKQSAARPSGM